MMTETVTEGRLDLRHSIHMRDGAGQMVVAVTSDQALEVLRA